LHIYRKPITTDSIIPGDSCHPTEHKMAAVRYLTKRMEKYYLSTTNKEKERKIIENILQENKYDASIIYIPPKLKISRKKLGQNGQNLLTLVRKQSPLRNSSKTFQLTFRIPHAVPLVDYSHIILAQNRTNLTAAACINSPVLTVRLNMWSKLEGHSAQGFPNISGILSTTVINHESLNIF